MVPADNEMGRVLTRQRRAVRLTDYVTGLGRDLVVPAEMAESALEAWKALDAALGGQLAVPDACPGPDGQLMLSWESEPHYLELELFPDGHAEFFYRNDFTGALWDADFQVGVPLPMDAVARLRLFT